MTDYVEGVHLARTDERAAAVDALADLLGGRVGLSAVLGDLNLRTRRTWAPGLATREAFTWDRADRRTTRWWPQGITSSADADESGEVEGRRLLVTTWYAKPLPDGHHGSRISVVDLDRRRYRHVLLVVPTLTHDGTVGFEPLKVHAGGLVWHGNFLHVAATTRGLVTCDLDDLLRVPDDSAMDTFGYRYLLPARLDYRAMTEEGQEQLRYSFLSLDRSTTPPHLLAGEYARGDRTRRLVRYPLEESGLLSEDEGVARPLGLADGVHQTQGAVSAAGQLYLTVSRGPWTPGSVYAGRPGHLVRHRWATPVGPEDITYWPSTDRLWSLTEHPRRRWVFAMKRRTFGG